MTVAAAVSQADGTTRQQFGWINLLKAGAAQLIVLHHLAFYGPMSDYVRPLWPELLDWLGGSARIAVQVFLVIGGFLVAKSLSPAGHPGIASPLQAIWRRYAKLAPPFLAARHSRLIHDLKVTGGNRWTFGSSKTSWYIRTHGFTGDTRRDIQSKAVHPTQKKISLKSGRPQNRPEGALPPFIGRRRTDPQEGGCRKLYESASVL